MSSPTVKVARMFAEDRRAITDNASREITAQERQEREEKSALLKALRIEKQGPTLPERCDF
jgi:hypothetical protein